MSNIICPEIKFIFTQELEGISNSNSALPLKMTNSQFNKCTKFNFLTFFFVVIESPKSIQILFPGRDSLCP